MEHKHAYYDPIAARIRALRKKRNLTQKQVCELTGIRQDRQSRYEKGRTVIWLIEAVALQKALQLESMDGLIPKYLPTEKFCEKYQLTL